MVHGIDRNALFTLCDGLLDPYASGMFFEGWRDTLPTEPQSVPSGYEPPPVSDASTWLLRVGWTKAPPIGMLDTPGPRRLVLVDAD